MSTLTRQSSGTRVPDYKDYMNFVSAYKNGKSETEDHQVAEPVFKTIKSKNNNFDTAGTMAVQLKPTCDSYSNFLEKTKNKKFESVKPPIPSRDNVDSIKVATKKPVKLKTEIFLEINDDSKQSNETKAEQKPVQKVPLGRTLSREVENKRRMFENSTSSDPVIQDSQKKFNKILVTIDRNGYVGGKAREVAPEINKNGNLKLSSNLIENLDSKLNKTEFDIKTHTEHPYVKTENSVFEEKFHSVKKLKEELSVTLGSNLRRHSLQGCDRKIKQEPPLVKSPQKNIANNVRNDVLRKSPGLHLQNNNASPPPPPPPPMPSFSNEKQIKSKSSRKIPTNKNIMDGGCQNDIQRSPLGFKSSPTMVPSDDHQVSKLANGDNMKKQKSSTLGRNDPLVRKLTYGAMLDMYGAYHDKANSYVATLPKKYVKKGNGLQKIIDDIAAQGGLNKLSGRSNPKTEVE